MMHSARAALLVAFVGASGLGVARLHDAQRARANVSPASGPSGDVRHPARIPPLRPPRSAQEVAPPPPPSAESIAVTAARVAVGKAIFFDGSLSDPPGTSCASCHDPARGFSGDHGSGAGVPAGSRPGVLARRTAPSLLYLRYVPRFRVTTEGDDRASFDGEAYGGLFWDGRVDSLAELVRQPLLNPREMNGHDLGRVAQKLRAAPYAPAMERAYLGALATDEAATGAFGAALEAFMLSPAMAPFSSKYDDVVRGDAAFSPEEQQGLAAFRDPKRGGCASCHTLAPHPRAPEESMFTDYGYESAGAPRNTRLRVRDEDRGLCERPDDRSSTNADRFCATFRTPSLRNVALRPAFMHNGAFTSLRDVVEFYATRATDPKRWYPSGAVFDDTPAAYRGNVDVVSAPYDRKPGDAPAFSESDVDAVVAFLETLTDRTLGAPAP